jgi:hypothetical protein
MFRFKNHNVINERGKVMEVVGNVDQENRNIGVNSRNNGLHQQWDIVYADEWKEEPKKGEMNEEFGLIVEKDFHVVSQLKENIS